MKFLKCRPKENNASKYATHPRPKMSWPNILMVHV